MRLSWRGRPPKANDRTCHHGYARPLRQRGTAPRGDLLRQPRHLLQRGDGLCRRAPGARRAERLLGFTAVGQFGQPRTGECYRVRGVWRRDPRHGLQVQVESATPETPQSIAAIERYLAGSTIKGLGPTMPAPWCSISARRPTTSSNRGANGSRRCAASARCGPAPSARPGRSMKAPPADDPAGGDRPPHPAAGPGALPPVRRRGLEVLSANPTAWPRRCGALASAPATRSPPTWASPVTPPSGCGPG